MNTPMTPNLDQERVERAAEIVAGALKQRDVMGYHNAAEILARAAITAYLGDTHVSGWQDIATAPKDGRHVMLGMADEEYVGQGYYDEAADAWFPPLQSDTDVPDMRMYPTHWQPLPDPPAHPGKEG